MSVIDVIVPCYNYARFLEPCVASVLAQRDVALRVLIIDDASPDDTPAIGQRLAASDERVAYIRNEPNLGLIGTANKGLFEWARAAYTLLLSADDALTPGALARAVRVLDAHPEAGMVFGPALIIKDDGAAWPDAPDAAVPTCQIISGPRFLQRSCEFSTPLASPTAVLRTQMQQASGGYCPKFRHTSDMEMWMRFATKGPIAAIKEPQAYYRWHGANMTLLHTTGALSDRRERLTTCEYVYENWGGQNIPGFQGWIAQMKQTFAREALWLAGQTIEADDLEGYEACIRLASELDPSLKGSASWWRLQAKKALGPAVSRNLRSAVNALRGAGAPTSQADWFETSREFGWWPEMEPSPAAAAR